MRTILSLILGSLILISHLVYAQEVEFSYQIDDRAASNASWQVGNVIVEGKIFFNTEIANVNSYRVFIGITSKGYYVVQDFYKQSNNKLTDPYVLMYRDHVEIMREYSFPMDSTLTIWYENGQKAHESYREDGLQQGLMTDWHINGQKVREYFFQNGKANGILTRWRYDNGQKVEETNYQDGMKNGLSTQWYANGQKGREGHYQNNEQQGLWIDWYSNGQKQFEGSYQNGQKHGLWTAWHENGEIMWEIWYSNGKIIRRKDY